MDFEISDDQQAFADLTAQILEAGSAHDQLRKLEAAGGLRFEESLWQELGRTGLLGIAIPEAYGGAGQGFFELALVMEQVGRRTAPVPVLETLVLAALPIAEFGTESQKQHWLPRIAQAKAVATAALIEDQADPDSPVTTVVEEAGEFILDGEKMCVPAGSLADLFLVPASLPDGTVLVLLVPREVSGLEVTALQTTSGQPEAQVVLNQVRLPAQSELGIRGQGGDVLRFMREHGTAAYCSLAVGVCSEALRLTAEYSKERKQFDQPIATFQAVGQRQADAYVDTEAIRLTSWQAAWRLSARLEASESVAVAKYWAALGGQRVVHTAAHQHGGMGVDRDYPLHRYFLYAKQLELSLGGGQHHLRALGRMLADGVAS